MMPPSVLTMLGASSASYRADAPYVRYWLRCS